METDKVHQLKRMIESGYGMTGKPIPPKRMNKLKKLLKDIEDENKKVPVNNNN